MRKANFYFDQNKNNKESIPGWKNQRPNNFDSKRKQNKFHKTWEIIIEGIRVIITKVLNLKILQYPILFLIKPNTKRTLKMWGVWRETIP